MVNNRGDFRRQLPRCFDVRGCLPPTSCTDNASSRIERHVDGREPVVCRGCAGLAAAVGNDRPHCGWRGGAVPND
jgi:hypothetical protein